MKINDKVAKRLAAAGLSAAIVLAGAGTVSHFEGKSNQAYLDPVSIWTICYGATSGVKRGDFKTDDQCIDSLASELLHHHRGMMKHIKIDISDKEEAAYLSFTYNVGVGAFSRSTLVRFLNAGEREEACNQLLRWNRAGGAVLRGLTLRREAENKLCLEGIADEASGKELEE